MKETRLTDCQFSQSLKQTTIVTFSASKEDPPVH